MPAEDSPTLHNYASFRYGVEFRLGALLRHNVSLYEVAVIAIPSYIFSVETRNEINADTL
jgi:hypothetical protein